MPFPFSFIKSSGSTWSPPDASVVLRAWYRADLGVTEVGGTVSAWDDQSGAGDANRDLAGAIGTMPSYVASDAAYGNNSVLTFSGDKLVRAGNWSSTPATPITIVVVGEVSGAVSAMLSDGAAADMIWDDGSEGKFYSDGFAPNLFSGVSLATPQVVMVSDDGSGGAAAAKIFVTNLTTAAADDLTTFQPVNGFDVGVGVAGVSDLTGKIAEIIVWAGILSAGDLTSLRDYLNTTRAYGLSVT